MKISELRSAYEDASGTASELSRQLAFAGIAIIWILRVGHESGGIEFDAALKAPLACFVFTLAFDLSQYIYKSFVWGMLNWLYWRRHQNNEHDVVIQGWVNYISLGFFWSKLAAVSIAYAKLALFFIDKF